MFLSLAKKTLIGSAFIATGLILVSCGEDAESLSTKVAGQNIDCQWKPLFNELADYYFPYENKDYAGQPDGKYNITIESTYSNGSLNIKEIVSPPYIKTGSTFAPEYPQHWSMRELTEEHQELVKNGNGVSSCTIKSITPKS